MSPESNEFRVSNGGIDNEFDTFNANYKDEFTTLSAARLFSPFDNNEFEIKLFVQASDTPTTVSGFGAIFTDVDLAP